MDRQVNAIAGRLSLRAPQRHSLEVLDRVTEIASRNQVSLRAHARMGFEGVSTYTDSAEEWVIVAWDLSRAAIIPA